MSSVHRQFPARRSRGINPTTRELLVLYKCEGTIFPHVARISIPITAHSTLALTDEVA